MPSPRILFRIHAIQRMFERGISYDDVKRGIQNGEVIEEYEDAIPYPGRLILGWSRFPVEAGSSLRGDEGGLRPPRRRGNRPLHIVLADNEADDEIIGITVYEPDSAQWRSDFRRRKQ